MSVVGVLLAAGSARRFGSDKLLHRLVHGVPIVVQSARHLRAAVPRVVAVVRPGAQDTRVALEAEGCEVVTCERAAEGMGASLACAVGAAGAAGGYLVALGDMPFIRPSSIEAVRAALEAGAPLVAPYFHRRRGHPVGIAAAFRAELAACAGDAGARALFEAHAASVRKVPVGDPGVIRDIDQPEDLAPPVLE